MKRKVKRFASFILALAFVIGIFGDLSAQSVQDSLVQTARQNAEILASRKFSGRGYDLEGHVLAANFIASEFEKAGLKSIPNAENPARPYLHYFEFPYNNPLTAKLVINGTELKIGEDFIINRESGSVNYSGKAKDAGYGLPKKMAKALKKDRVVVVRDGLPPKIAEDKEKAAEFKDVKRLGSKLKGVEESQVPAIIGGRKKLTAAMSTEAPVGYGYVEVRSDKLPAKVKKVELSIEQEMQDIRTQNIIGWVEGSEYPDSFIIVSAHYDHLGMQGEAVFWGANDNASGTAMIISMAYHFAQPANQPKYSMVFIGFGGEECGLIGSQHYVYRNPVFPLAQTKFILNLDLMGNGDKGIMAVGGKDFPKRWETLRDLNTAQGDAIPKVKSRKNAPNSDHYWFIKEGIQGFFIYTEGGPPHYHDVNDTSENLVFSRYVEVRELMIKFLQSF